MKRIFSLFCFVLLLATIASAQQTQTATRRDPAAMEVVTPARRFEIQTERLRAAFETANQPAMIRQETNLRTFMRSEIERSEAGNSTGQARQQAILAAFEGFSFTQTNPAGAEAKLQLLAEFATLILK